ncbi:hypothetical protein [Aeromicrobium sp. IC_218]|uniref:hypothetical protein n=1 Tax=Aeromicrobium sp. IC_218 TaxID=2545468 RepID=UPI0010386D91|nr:hypothetical protein [Aeromicrobium sp. IC_218]TCI97761.1 hypothetical protein E0W78_10620 [Aeromicrobium sp. IC_218]
MLDLRTTLDRAAGDGRPDGRPVDPAPDLRRGRAALVRRTRRRRAAGLGALALVGVAAVGVALDRPATQRLPSDTVASSPVDAQVALVAATLEAEPYAFGLTPRGWGVGGRTPTAVTIVPDDGSTSADPDDFRGKLVVMLDANPLDGREVERDGRTFWITSGGGYTTMATPTLPGEREGVVRIQFPDGAGWDEDAMLDFLGSVRVGDTAEPGVG